MKQTRSDSSSGSRCNRGAAAESDAIGEYTVAEVDAIGEQLLKQTQSIDIVAPEVRVHQISALDWLTQANDGAVAE